MKHPRHLFAATLFALFATPFAFLPAAYGAGANQPAYEAGANKTALRPLVQLAPTPQILDASPQQSQQEWKEQQAEYWKGQEERRAQQQAAQRRMEAVLAPAEELADVIRAAWNEGTPPNQLRAQMPIQLIVSQLQRFLLAGYRPELLHSAVSGARLYTHTRYRADPNQAEFDPVGTMTMISNLTTLMLVWDQKYPNLSPLVRTAICEAHAIFTSRIRVEDLELDDRAYYADHPTPANADHPTPVGNQAHPTISANHPPRQDLSFFLPCLLELAQRTAAPQSAPAASLTPTSSRAPAAEAEGEGEYILVSPQDAQESPQDAQGSQDTNKEATVSPPPEETAQARATEAAPGTDAANAAETQTNDESPEEIANRIKWAAITAAYYYSEDTLVNHMRNLDLFDRVYRASEGDGDFADQIADWLATFLDSTPERGEWETVYNLVVPWMVQQQQSTQRTHVPFSLHPLEEANEEVLLLRTVNDPENTVNILRFYLQQSDSAHTNEAQPAPATNEA